MMSETEQVCQGEGEGGKKDRIYDCIPPSQQPGKVGSISISQMEK